jgi:hypothetical protein
MNYIYSLLGLAAAEKIRLVYLLPGQLDDVIRCKIEKVSLKNPGAYEAPPYAWGSRSNPHQIFLNDCAYDITQNLGVPLKHLKLRERRGESKSMLYALIRTILKSDLSKSKRCA